MNIRFTSNSSGSGTKPKEAEEEADNDQNSGAESKISLGSVSSDSLSISHNKDDDDDAEEEEKSEAYSNSEAEKSESMSDSLEKSNKQAKESIEESIIEEIIDEVVESSENHLKIKQRALFGLDEVEKPDADLDSSGSSKENVEPQSPGSRKLKEKEKELSPLQEDVILINNNKVSLNILKQQLANSQDNSLNTTNDISDLAKDNTYQNSAEREDSSSVPVQIRSLELSQAQPDLSARGFNSLGTAVEFKLPRTEENW